MSFFNFYTETSTALDTIKGEKYIKFLNHRIFERKWTLPLQMLGFTATVKHSDCICTMPWPCSYYTVAEFK